MLRSLLLALLLAAGPASAQAPADSAAPVAPSPSAAPVARPAAAPRGGTVPAPADSASVAAPPEAGAIGRVRAALASGDALPPPGPFPALDPALAGVVWNVPEDAEAAVDDLLAMRRAGVRAARTALIADTTVLRAASLLGIALWQDLPVAGLPAVFLRDRTADATALLAEALERARPYPAARHFGLARASDTSDRRAVPYFEALTAVARERGAPGTQTYYVSRFPEDDRAAAAVDVVLLDAREEDPVDVLRRWRSRRDAPVGLASMGVGVRPGQTGGWRTSGTEAAQARTLEDAFTALIGLDQPPAAAFVYRWRDADSDLVERDQRAEVAGTRFGLLGEGDVPRPALDVASGFWSGRQRVFAFDAGSGVRQERRASSLLLIGWGLVLGLGVLYAGAPRLSGLAPRYFGRRDLYHEAVARGYDLSAAETTGLAMVLTLAVGVVGASALRALARTDALVAATASWSVDAQAQLTGLLGKPLALVGVLALGYAAWLLMTLLWLNLMNGRRRRLRPAQALSLAVWCRWGWLPLMVGSLLLGSIDAGLATVLAPAVLGLGLLIEVVAGYRMMGDLHRVTSAPPARVLLIGFGVPFLLTIAGLVVLSISSSDELGFLWHLATRG